MKTSKQLTLRGMRFVALLGTTTVIATACKPDVAFNEWKAKEAPPVKPYGLFVSPETINFGNILINSETSTTVTISNQTDNTYKLDFPPPGKSEFKTKPKKCGNIAPGKTCEFEVRFKPGLALSYQDQIAVEAKKIKNNEEVDEDAKPDENKKVSLSGNGFIIPPSPNDNLSVIGWYSYKQPTKIAMNNSLAGFENCQTIPAGNIYKPEDYGRAEEYCYEPSGANGMSLPTSDFSKLTSYILQTGSSFQSVQTLDELFSGPDDLKSDNVCWKEALFYYALSYVLVPRSTDLASSTFDMNFAVSNVDDGIQFITNGEISGRFHLGANSSISVHRTTAGNKNLLKHGANTIVALWIDDCAGGRLIKDARLTDSSGTTVQVIKPNVVNGYVYNKLNAMAIKNADVKVVNASGTVLATTKTDSQGFYQVEGLSDGTIEVQISSGPQKSSTQVTLDHNKATSAAIEVSAGL